jgi:hypothetical protein
MRRHDSIARSSALCAAASQYHDRRSSSRMCFCCNLVRRPDHPAVSVGGEAKTARHLGPPKTAIAAASRQRRISGEANPQPPIRSSADEQFSLLKGNPQHPSLQFKKVGNWHGQEIYSVRVTLSHRALAFKRTYGFLWFWIGDHEAYENLIA